VDEGKLEWDEPVVSYLPDFRLHDEHATFHLTPRDTLTHRSGLPRHDLVWYGDETTSRADLVRRLRHLPPSKDLREIWQYNNLMYLTAGYLTEVLTGVSWEEAVRERLLEPLGMDRSNFDVAVSQADPDHALPYLEKEDKLVRIPFRSITVMGPAGSINSCASDLTRWMLMHLGEGAVDGRKILGAATVRELHTPQMTIPAVPEEKDRSPMSYAFGWFTEAWRGKWLVHHGGNIDGFSALVSLFPRDGVGIAVLVNRNGSPLPGLATYTVADRVFGLESKDWIGDAARKRDAAKGLVEEAEKNKARFRVEDTDPAHPLGDYAGEFSHPGYGTVEIREEQGKLTALFHGLRMPLTHWHYETFHVEADRDDEVIPENLRITFVTDGAGRVGGFHSPFEPAVEPAMFRKEPDRRLRDPDYLARLAGEYTLPGQVVAVEVRGNRLVLRVPGQPTYELEPSGPDEFRLSVVEGYSVRFTVPASGPATEAIFVQPNGVFPAARK
jgi:CubicO group peptidase (beta-lactamase class C family)